jgi:hypothetical protein
MSKTIRAMPWSYSVRNLNFALIHKKLLQTEYRRGFAVGAEEP